MARAIGYSAGRMMGNRLEQVVNHSITAQPVRKDLQRCVLEHYSGCATCLHDTRRNSKAWLKGQKSHWSGELSFFTAKSVTSINAVE